MREFGWTYEQMINTPAEIINRELSWLITEGKFRKEHKDG